VTINRGYRSLRSLNPRLISSHRSAVPRTLMLEQAQTYRDLSSSLRIDWGLCHIMFAYVAPQAPRSQLPFLDRP
jgi:hypothetical protein